MSALVVQNRHLLALVTGPAWLVGFWRGDAADQPLLYWLHFGLAAGCAVLRVYNRASDATVIGLVIADLEMTDASARLNVRAGQITTGGATRPVEGILQVVTARCPEYRYGDEVALKRRRQQVNRQMTAWARGESILTSSS